jgi:hypothetical protein
MVALPDKWYGMSLPEVGTTRALDQRFSFGCQKGGGHVGPNGFSFILRLMVWQRHGLALMPSDAVQMRPGLNGSRVLLPSSEMGGKIIRGSYKMDNLTTPQTPPCLS